MKEPPHQVLRARLGKVGVWTFAFDVRPVARIKDDAAAIESMGYSALWVPEGSTSRDAFAHLAILLGATEHLTVASGIANVTARQPEVMAAGFRTLADRWPQRLVAGVGIGHEYSTESRGHEWTRPLSRMRSYLDRMDAATAVPTEEEPARVLAALGDAMLRLAADRGLGAHSYFVPVAHTRRARDVLGPEPILAVEQGVVIDEDPSTARSVARGWARGYLELPNYANNLRRLGFSDRDVDGGGSDALIDATFAFGVNAAASRVRDHIDAGADHVCVQAIGRDDRDVGLPQLRAIAEALSLRP